MHSEKTQKFGNHVKVQKPNFVKTIDLKWIINNQGADFKKHDILQEISSWIILTFELISAILNVGGVRYDFEVVDGRWV